MKPSLLKIILLLGILLCFFSNLRFVGSLLIFISLTIFFVRYIYRTLHQFLWSTNDADGKNNIVVRSNPSKEAMDLKNALEKRGVMVKVEFYDGHKHVDLFIPQAKLDIEVDGIHHLTDPHQILADLARGYYSHKDGYDTIHIPNKMIHQYLNEIADALAEAVRIKNRKLRVHIK